MQDHMTDDNDYNIVSYNNNGQTEVHLIWCRTT